jgi:uncharacterized protein YsxB (DUF464 family)
VIRTRFFNNGGVMCGFEVSGHAEYADKGHDIVCASVSSAVQMTANTVTEVIGVEAHVSDVDGKVSLQLGQCTDSEKIVAARAVIKGLRLHLSLLSKQYRGTISIEDSEV